MSKQQHDQDEQQAPKGADASRSDKEESTPAPSKTSEASSSNASPPAAEKSSKSQRSRSRGRRGNGTGKADEGAGTRPTATDTAAPGERTDTGTGPGETAESAKPKQASAAPEGTAAAPENTPDTPASGAPASTSSTDKPAAASPATTGATSETSAASTPGTASDDKRSSAGASTTPSRPASGGAGGTGAKTSTPGGGNGGSGQRLGLAALLLVIALAVVVALLGWWGWQRLEAQQQRLDQADANAEAIADLESRFEDSESERQSALEEAQASLRDEFESYRGEVDDTLDRVLDELSSQQDTDEREWLHAEAAYLLRLANQRLQLERDVEGAAALLRTADERLREADNPALVPVRREIASELAELDSVPRVDRAGLYLAINAQQQQLAKLPLTQDIEEIAAQPGEDTPPSGGWQEQLGRFASELKDLVTVRRHDQELEALITPQQESYLRQNARLVLEQAQLALLREEPELYQASLDKAIELVRGYYATDRDGVETTLERLNELRDASIRPELPDISGSQQALATFIERRFESNGDGEGDDA